MSSDGESNTNKGANRKRKCTQVYKKEWEKEFPDWLQESSEGTKYAYCKSCNKDININSGKDALKKHNLSQVHSVKMSSLTGTKTEQIDQAETMPSLLTLKKKQIKRVQRYRREWENDDLFKSWLQPDAHDNLKAHCTVCRGSSLRAEKTVLMLHAKSKKHARNMQLVNSVLHTCRTCLSTDAESRSIFTISEEFKIPFNEILEVVTGVQAKEGDSLPASICPACRVSLTSAYQYLLQAKLADFQLRQSEIKSVVMPEEGAVQIKVTNSDEGFIIEYLDEDAKYFNVTAAEIPKGNQQTHLCSYCGGTFKSLCVLQSHILKCLGNPDIDTVNSNSCLVCQQSFDSMQKLLRHVRMKHETKYSDFPKETGSRLSGLERCHIPVVGTIELPTVEPRTEVKVKSASCGLCGHRCSRQELPVHVREHDADIALVCTLCGHAYLKTSFFKTHLAENHSEISLTPCEDELITEEIEGDSETVRSTEYHRSSTIGELLSDAQDTSAGRGTEAQECAACGRLLLSAAAMSAHCDEEHPHLSTCCYLCSKSFSSVKAAAAHRVLCERRSVRRSCATCDAVFHTKAQMVKHLRLHAFECDICPKKFRNINNLRSHKRTHEPARESRRYLCVHCGHRFSSSESLKVHIRRHTGERPFKCNICGRGYPRKEELNWHVRIHTGERPYKCKQCSKAFRRNTCLARHMRVHTGARPYSCPHCERSFTQSNDLARHVRQHLGDKPYQCNICLGTFNQLRELQNHRKLLNHMSDWNSDARQTPLKTVQSDISRSDSEADVNESISDEVLDATSVIVEEYTPDLKENVSDIAKESPVVLRAPVAIDRAPSPEAVPDPERRKSNDICWSVPIV